MGTERLKLLVGAILTLGLLTLAASVALGRVEEKSSFGLTAILALLGKVELDFSDWAFRGEWRKDKPEVPPAETLSKPG